MDKFEFRKAVYSKVDQLPTLPAALPKLLALMEDENASGNSIVEAISTDPALTAKIMQVANSAYYGFSKTISNLDRAVPLLGMNMVKSLALTMGVIRSLPTGNDSIHFSREGLWTHSLAVATAITEMGKRLRLETEYLFTLGLLHDMGKVVLVQFFNDLYIPALEKANETEGGDLAEVEREVIGLDHGDVGKILLDRWKFPAVIAEPIGCHHQDEIPDKVDEVDVALIKVADRIALESGVGAAGNPSIPAIPESCFKALSMNPSDLESMNQFMQGKADEIASFYSAMG